MGNIAQQSAETLIIAPDSKQITNDKAANALLAGPPPRKEWEQYYRL